MIEELQKRRDLNFQDLRRIVKACFMRGKGSVPLSTYETLLERFAELIEALNGENIDTLMLLNSYYYEIPMFPEAIADKYFLFEEKILHLVINAL